MKTKLSIIIPSLNEKYYLPKILSYIKEQRQKNIEVIIANGGKFKKIREIGRSFGARVVDIPIKNPAYARNQGAKASKGEILLFLDADVFLPKDFLSQILKNFEERKLDIAGVYAKPSSKKLFDKIFWKFYNFALFVMKFIRPEASGFCILCRRTLHEKINGYDETITYREDADYTSRASRYGKFGLLKPEIIVSVRRFDEEGRIKLLWKYIKLAFLGFFRTIRGDVGYHFGIYKEKMKKAYKHPVRTTKKVIKGMAKSTKELFSQTNDTS